MAAQVKRPPAARDGVPTEHEELRQILSSPTQFAKKILGVDTWNVPDQMLEALKEPRAKVAVRSCHASGKTFSAGIATAWFMNRYADGIVATTAPTWNQVKNLMWKEIHACIGKSRIKWPKANNTEWRFGKEHFAIGISTTESEKFQGIHAPHVLIIVDEAPGVAEDIWIAIESIESGGDVRVLALGNPTISSGRFYDAFSRNRAGWKTFTIDCFDTPNFAGVPGANPDEKLATLLEWESADPDYKNKPEHPLNQNPRPYLISRAWVVERFHAWGTNSPLWTARVRGRFPTQSEYALIALDWVEESLYREPKPGAHCLGVDVARAGADYTAYCYLIGNQVVRLWKDHTRTTTRIVDQVSKLYRADPQLQVVIDDTGVGGGVTDGCRALNIPVIAFNAGNSPTYNSDARNRGSESYWNLAASFRDGDVSISPDIDLATVEELTQQLVQVEYETDNPKHLVTVHKKGRKDDLASPDLGDALNMAWEAHRIETNAPALMSLSIEPQLSSGVSASQADKPRFWDGFASRTQRLNMNAPQPDPDAPGFSMVAAVTMICPQCGNLATLTEIGRVGDTKNFTLNCPHCQLRDKLIQSRVAPAAGRAL